MAGWCLTVACALLWEAYALLTGHETLTDGARRIRRRPWLLTVVSTVIAALLYHLFVEAEENA